MANDKAANEALAAWALAVTRAVRTVCGAGFEDVTGKYKELCSALGVDPTELGAGGTISAEKLPAAAAKGSEPKKAPAKSAAKPAKDDKPDDWSE